MGVEKIKAVKKLAITINSFLVLSLVMVGMTGCNSGGVAGANELEPVEVTEYEGEILSPVSALQESSMNGVQYIDKESYRLKVTGLVQNPKSYTYDEVISDFQQYKKVVTLNCVGGWSATILWGGPLVEDLIGEANPLPDAKVVIFYASDNYTTSLPLDYIIENSILLADKMNEVTISPEMGFPFQLVAENKWGYKWIKWVTEIELSDNVSYEGFWEARGYDNAGDLDKDF